MKLPGSYLPYANLFLRALSLGAKFLLIVYMGRSLSTEALGDYGLFATSVTLAIYLLGLDFYAFTTREILEASPEKERTLIRNQFLFHLFMYLLILPPLYLLFLQGILKTQLAWYFYLILILEHLTTELYRLYTVLKRPFFANFLLFLKTGAWIFPLVVLWIVSPNTASLDTLWPFWTAGAALSLAIGVAGLRNRFSLPRKIPSVDWRWIAAGVRVSLPFFIATIAYKTIEFSDRYMIDWFLNRESVGIYTFYAGIANVVNIAVFTLVIMIDYPRLVEAWQRNEREIFATLRKSFFKKTLTASVLSAIIVAACMIPLADFLGKSAFEEELPAFWILVAANVALNLSFVPHYILYALKRDRTIRDATLTGALANVGLNVVLIPVLGLSGAAIATFASFLLIWSIKSFSTKSLKFEVS